MFILDSLMISGIRWALETALTAAEAEMNDDSVLREQLLEAEMRREMGEITDDEFRDIERDLLARIREIRERRDGGSGAIDMGALNNVVMLAIAVTKAALVVLFFMHVRWGTRLTWVVAASGFFWLLILFGLTMQDYLTRGWVPGPWR